MGKGLTSTQRHRIHWLARQPNGEGAVLPATAEALDRRGYAHAIDTTRVRLTDHGWRFAQTLKEIGE